MEQDRYLEAIELLHEALELARRRGYRTWEAQVVTQLADTFSSLGRWDEAIALVEEVPGGVSREPLTGASSLLVVARVALGRGTYDRVTTLLDALADMPTTGDRQDQTSFFVAEAIVSRANGRYTDAIKAGRTAFDLSRYQSQIHYGTEGLVEAVEAAFQCEDPDTVKELLAMIDDLEPIEHRPFLDAQVARLKARLAAASGDGAAEQLFTEAIIGFRRIDVPFWLAVTLLEYSEWLTDVRANDPEPYVAESAATFLALRATPWLDRINALEPTSFAQP
jgi:tetratricopeptide (TPR) repeat protein